MLTGCNCFQIWPIFLCVGMKGRVSADFLCKLACSIHTGQTWLVSQGSHGPPSSPGLTSGAESSFALRSLASPCPAFRRCPLKGSQPPRSRGPGFLPHKAFHCRCLGGMLGNSQWQPASLGTGRPPTGKGGHFFGSP